MYFFSAPNAETQQTEKRAAFLGWAVFALLGKFIDCNTNAICGRL
jgi:hypothetical protein